MDLTNDFYTTEDIVRIVRDKYGLYKNDSSATNSVHRIVGILGIKDALDPYKKSHRRYCKADTEKIIRQIMHTNPEAFPVKEELDMLGNTLTVWSDGWIVPKHKGYSRNEACDITVTVQKCTHGDGKNPGERLCFTMTKDTYKAIFGTGRRVTFRYDKLNNILFIIPTEIQGVGSWAVSATQSRYKFTMPLTAKNKDIVCQFVGRYKISDLDKRKFYADGNIHTAFGFHKKTQEEF